MHTSTKWLIGEIVVVSILITLLNIAGNPMFLPYRWHKLLHVLGWGLPSSSGISS